MKLHEQVYPSGRGNAGYYEGRERLKYRDETGRQHFDYFHKIRAVPGTWLSAACRRFGWAAVYGKQDGYGAYVEGIVRKADGSIYESTVGPMRQDSIEPGAHFYIEIYQGGGRRRPIDIDEIPEKHRGRVRVDDPSVDVGAVVGLGLDVVIGILDEAGVGPFGFIMVPFQMADLGTNQWVLLTSLRAECYATTAFNLQQYEDWVPDLSRMFQDQPRGKKYITRQGDWLFGKEMTLDQIWNVTWVETRKRLAAQFKKVYTKLYMDMSREGANKPLGELRLRRYLKDRCLRDYKNGANHCDVVMKSAGSAMKGKIASTARPLWDMFRNRVKYPL